MNRGRIQHFGCRRNIAGISFSYHAAGILVCLLSYRIADIFLTPKNPFFLWVRIPNADNINILDFLIKESFRQTDLTDAFLQLIKIIHRVARLETLVVQGKALDDIFPKPLCCPDAKSHALMGFDPITD